MYVKRIFYDDYTSLDSSEKVLNAPEWCEVEQIIKRLDGKFVTQITMDCGNEDNYLCIAGGNQGLCNVYVSENDNEVNYQLMNVKSIDTKFHKLITGGQEGDFEDQICVTIDYAMVAIKVYYESGTRYSKYIWQNN